ncbi:hypothetical protein ACFLVX_05200 [Chloroflexota bacterium]
MEEEHFQQLRQFMTKLSAGLVPLDVQDELVQLLADCWHMFSGSDQEGMGAYKLKRMKNPLWDTPLLTFSIARHGGMALGSTRAEVQEWAVDLDRRVAVCQIIGYRQVHPRQSAIDVKPIADELVRLILGSSQGDRLQWSADGRVRILSGKIFPSDSATNKTLEGRKKRLVKAMEERLGPHGWQRHGSWWERKG